MDDFFPPLEEERGGFYGSHPNGASSSLSHLGQRSTYHLSSAELWRDVANKNTISITAHHCRHQLLSRGKGQKRGEPEDF